MTIVVDGTYEGDGVLRLDKPVDLEKKAKVHVTIESEPEPPAIAPDDPTGWNAARRFIGMWKGAPGRTESSLSEDHDEALYKRR
jgi:hypothetical protein